MATTDNLGINEELKDNSDSGELEENYESGSIPNSKRYQGLYDRISSRYGKTVANTHTNAMTVLLILNGCPLIKWIDGRPNYGYIVVSNPRLPVIYKPRSSTKYPKDGIGVPVVYKDSTLADVLERESKNWLLDKWQLLSGVTPISVGEEFHNEYYFEEIIEELSAISLTSTEYSGIMDYALDEEGLYSNASNIMNRNYPAIINTKFEGPMTFSDWIKYMFTDYMLRSNLELMEYYVQNSMHPSIKRSYSLVQVLTEFVPFIMKFGTLYNPILNDNEPDGREDTLAILQDEIGSIFRESLCSGNVLGIWGTKSGVGYTDKIRVCYTTRGAAEKILRINMAKDVQIPYPSRKVELYSPKLFTGLIYNALWGRSMTKSILDGMFYSAKIPWYMLVRDNRIVGFDCYQPKDTQDISVVQVDYHQMLVYTYLASITGTTNVSLMHRIDQLLDVMSFDIGRIESGTLLGNWVEASFE